MRTSRVDWATILGQFRESGLSQKKFCEQKGISSTSLGYWLKKERVRSPPPIRKESEFVELELVPRSPGVVAPRCEGETEIVVELPLGVVMRFRRLVR